MNWLLLIGILAFIASLLTPVWYLGLAAAVIYLLFNVQRALYMRSLQPQGRGGVGGFLSAVAFGCKESVDIFKKLRDC